MEIIPKTLLIFGIQITLGVSALFISNQSRAQSPGGVWELPIPTSPEPRSKPQYEIQRDRPVIPRKEPCKCKSGQTQILTIPILSGELVCIGSITYKCIASNQCKAKTVTVSDPDGNLTLDSWDGIWAIAEFPTETPQNCAPAASTGQIRNE